MPSYIPVNHDMTEEEAIHIAMGLIPKGLLSIPMLVCRGVPKPLAKEIIDKAEGQYIKPVNQWPPTGLTCTEWR